ncbi:hypothetical protein LOTGIDRAFT_212528 [Lottia gigantea]|uniref:AAA+ ATPase domain-containing protein n=1 Tax=Lottia gigantea TaxID=225164 RepID=V4B656_LOTGI|nr:hypothetical protein LOTGIDRAFT_212528 [Lottia gigantea]ESP03016.1 hypothetical protein LOTGIDRAFT_212528 [Lottia gigantea]
MKKSSLEVPSVLESDKTSKELSDKIKVAFSEGYMSGLKSNTNGKKSKNLRNFFATMYNICLYLLIIVVYYITAIQSPEFKKLFGVNKFMVQPEFVKTTFKDVKGSDEAKEELEQVVDYLSDPDKYTSLGAKLPKGVLLVGPPGVGKTLLARAVAGEAGVPYFQASGAEFDEIFAGSGARKIRDLFGQAKGHAPCVIFLDEIDSVGKKRSSESFHPYANQTVNQLLSEMDGFTENRGIIVIGATNKLENLDSAVTRAGRFDVTVHINKPDLKGREELLGYYLAKVKTDKSLDVRSLASLTIGLTGADISNLVNQAALQATVEGCQTVQRSHLDFAFDKVSMGPAKKSKIPDRKVNLQTAYHEAGHAIVAFFTEEANQVYKVTILPRGSSLGHTSLLPEEDEYGFSKSQLMAQIDVSMGGQVAEELIYGKQNISTGASSDIQLATAVATNMVTKFGFNDKLGPRNINMKSASPNMKDIVDKEIEVVLKATYQRAKKIIESHSNELEVLAQSLMKYETLDKKEIEDILKGKIPDSFK